jgi:hypothetical protein
MSLTPPTDTAAQASIIDRVFSDAPSAQGQDSGTQAAESPGQDASLAPAGQDQAPLEAQAPATQAQAQAPTETQIPLSALLALMQAGALPGAVQQPAAPPPPAPKLKEERALEAFYDDRTRAEVVKFVLGGHYQPGAETNPTALATVEAFLTSQARNATLEARLAGFETAQAQAQVQAAQAQSQQYATNLFQSELAKFDTPNPALQETLADLVYNYQLQGYNIPQATQAAFERGKQLGLRLKGAQGRPSNQQRVVSGRETAQRVVSMPTGTQSQAPTQASPRSINDVLKAAFSGR